MKRLGGALDFGGEKARFAYRCLQATVSMVSKYGCAKYASESNDSKNFKLESHKADFNELPDEGSDREELVLILWNDAADVWSDKTSNSGKD